MKTGWRRTSLLDVCHVYQPKTISKSQMESDGTYPVYGANGIIGRYHSYNHESEELLLGCRGSVGQLHICQPKSWVTGNAMVVRPDTDSITRDFLAYSLTVPSVLAVAITGAAQPQITRKSLSQVRITLPPLPEQQRIVAILDEAFAGIATAVANTEKNLANARELFESYLNAVFSQRGDGWIEKPIETLVQKTCSLSYGIVQPGANVSGGMPVVRPTDMTEKVIRLHSLKTIDPSLAKAYARTTLHGGDLLLCVRGSTGVVSIADNELKGANVTRGIVPIRFDPTLVTQEIGYYLLKSPSVQEQIAEKTYGAALMQINIRDLRKIRMPIPPKEKHEEIVGTLDDLSDEARRLKSIYQQKLHDLAELKQSLLQKAFSGELATAPQDEIENALA